MRKRLWLTEKPSAAKSLAAGVCAALNLTIVNRESISRDGYILLSNGETITYLIGHLIQAKFLSEEHKAAKLETYFEFLPVVVKDFEYEPRPERNKNGEIRMQGGKQVPIRQYTVVTKLIKTASEIVNAGDIDREGQLIIDELLIHCGIDPVRLVNPIYRLALVSDREEEIKKQVLSLSEKNSDKKWVLRRHAALARSHCDVAVGMNGSLAYQAATGYRRASVGRVQTPVLCLVVDSEEKVANFKPRNYYIPVITLSDGTEMRFFKRAEAAGQPGFDEEGRIIDEAVAKRICSMASSGVKGKIISAKKTNESEAPPLPFSATVLASTVSKRTGMLPKQAEAAAQALYEKHKAISYVGTDCRYLPTSLHQDAPEILSALGRVFTQQVSGANVELLSKAWNDDKVDEHYAIIPTGRLPVNETIEEKAVFEAVCKRYIAQFYPPYEYVTSQLVAVFGQDEFRATKKETVRLGWKEIEGNLEQGGPRSDESNDMLDLAAGKVESNGSAVETPKVNIDAYQAGQVITARSARFKSEKTTAPARYDMATILDAMLSADRFAKTDEDRKILRMVEGIGTSRTRQGIVDNLIQRGLLYTVRKGKRHELHPHAIAKQLRNKLPPILCEVAMTAKWEISFAMIERGEIGWRQVVDRTYDFVDQIIDQAKTQRGSFKLDSNTQHPARVAA